MRPTAQLAERGAGPDWLHVLRLFVRGDLHDINGVADSVCEAYSDLGPPGISIAAAAIHACNVLC